MKRILQITLGLLSCMITTLGSCQTSTPINSVDSIRIAELNQYWAEVSRTVREADFAGYSATYHKDAVCVFTTREKKFSNPIDVQLGLWKQDFVDSKSGKTKNNVEFRFSQRIGSPTTAHETGIFYFTSVNKEGKVSGGQVHFESLLVKQNGRWLMLMEYQKSRGTQEAWDAMK